MEENNSASVSNIIDNSGNQSRNRFQEHSATPLKQNNKIINLKELMKFEGKSFIKNAYQAVLNRDPDSEGLAYYHDALNAGASKIKIIMLLKNSNEGKTSQTKIVGLKSSIILEKINTNLIFKFLKSIIIKVTQKKLAIIALQEDLQQTKVQIENLTNQIADMSVQIENLAIETNINLDAKIDDWEQFYSNFEDKFRGSKEIIKEKFKTYLPLLKSLKLNAQFPVIDLGCGRGEWLELLKENNVEAVGVDSNKISTTKCQQQGLTVINEEALNYLRKQPSNCFGTITAFHMIEHLPFIVLVNLLDEIFRTLNPGGAVILETPNPNNVTVGISSFYLDPTHKKPLPPSLMEYLLTIKGFKNIKILELNLVDTEIIKDQSELSNRFNAYFYGPQDYAVVGYK